jgi:hypothetical protein
MGATVVPGQLTEDYAAVINRMSAQIEDLTRRLAECSARNVSIINRRVWVEQRLIDAGSGKRPPPTREECQEWAVKLGVPEL